MKARPSKRKPTSEKRRQQMREWYLKNREKHIKACRAWTVAHPEQARASELRRRGKK